jgi:hypothetical protein
MTREKKLLLIVTFSLVSCNRPPAPVLALIDQSTQAPLVSNVSPGADVEIWVNNAGGPVATSQSVSGTFARVRLPGRLSPRQVVRARQKLSWFRTSDFSNAVTVENNYTTNRYDNERSGWNPNESTLTVSNVRSGFGEVRRHPVDAPIRAQPLYVQDVDIPGKGKHNVVFVATDASDSPPIKGDQMWAFDGDTGEVLWDNGSGNAGPRELLGTGESIPLVACNGRHGIWSTPVIDRTTNTMFVVAAVQKGAQSFFRLHAIDIATGKDRASPVVLDGATVKFTQGNTTVSLDPSIQNNRPGLLLDRGVLYIALGSSCDVGAYHGWIVAYDADLPGSPSFLNQMGVFNTSPLEVELGAGVWQSGLGLAADGDGTLYCLTGNGGFNPTLGSYGNTLLRLRLPPAGSSSKQMQVVKISGLAGPCSLRLDQNGSF